jgi:hypothetical protein
MKRFALSLLIAVAATAAAQSTVNRSVPIPATAVLGVATPDVFPAVVINGKAARYTPGARIFGTNNLLVVPSTLPAQSVVAVAVDNTGAVQTMWVLTPDEQKVKRNKF